MPDPDELVRQLQEAVAHHRAGRLTQAEAIYRRVRAAAPDHFDAVHLGGVVAYQRGEYAEAVELLQRAWRLNPQATVAAQRLALALIESGRTAEAEPVLREAVRRAPEQAEAWDSLAHGLKLLGRLSEAVACHRRATALKPGYAAGWFNLGLTLSQQGDHAEALRAHERALAADPAYAPGHFGRAQALQQCYDWPEALAAYARFLALEPGHLEARSYRLFALNNVDSISREELFAEHVAYGATVGHFSPPAFPNPPDPGRRLRVAILSPDLRQHACAAFLEPLLRHLDREAFELYLYHDHREEDAVSARLQAYAAVWRQVGGRSGRDVEMRIREDRPDLLIDLAGHTGMSRRLPLFARHLAPVQVSYLGYPHSTGVPAMGYRLTDAITDPEGEAEAFATEKLLRFAPTAWAYEPPAEAPPTGVPPCADGAPVTFGCFNHPGKITDTALRVWARLLAEVPEARLLLKGGGLGAAETSAVFRARLGAAGLPLARVDLLGRTPDIASHLALYGRVDVALDTWPYNGTTTTCEALWMGVPVVAVRGDRHAARVSASLLQAIGRRAWVGETVDDYLRIARELGGDRRGLAEIRRGLRAAVGASALLDHAGQAERFGRALRRGWTDWCAMQAKGGGRAASLSAVQILDSGQGAERSRGATLEGS